MKIYIFKEPDPRVLTLPFLVQRWVQPVLLTPRVQKGRPPDLKAWVKHLQGCLASSPPHTPRPTALALPLCHPVSCHSSSAALSSLRKAAALLMSFASSLWWEKHSPLYLNSQILTSPFQYHSFLFLFIRQGFRCFLTHVGINPVPFSVHQGHFYSLPSPCSQGHILMIIVCISIYVVLWFL